MNATEMNHKITQSRFKHLSEHPNKEECLEVTEMNPWRIVKSADTCKTEIIDPTQLGGAQPGCTNGTDSGENEASCLDEMHPLFPQQHLSALFQHLTASTKPPA